jgi:hypothetical protein
VGLFSLDGTMPPLSHLESCARGQHERLDSRGGDTSSSWCGARLQHPPFNSDSDVLHFSIQHNFGLGSFHAEFANVYANMHNQKLWAR